MFDISFKKVKDDSVILMRSVSKEEYIKFINNTLEPRNTVWRNDSEGIGYCYAIDEDPEEIINNFHRDYLLILEVSPILFSRCKVYYGHNYKTEYPTGEIGTRSWKECSKEIPFTAETCRSFLAVRI